VEQPETAALGILVQEEETSSAGDLADEENGLENSQNEAKGQSAEVESIQEFTHDDGSFSGAERAQFPPDEIVTADEVAVGEVGAPAHEAGEIETVTAASLPDGESSPAKARNEAASSQIPYIGPASRLGDDADETRLLSPEDDAAKRLASIIRWLGSTERAQLLEASGPLPADPGSPNRGGEGSTEGLAPDLGGLTPGLPHRQPGPS
jgi:hypothetical protein